MFLIFFEFKLRKTPKEIFIAKDGKKAYVEMFKFLGFGSDHMEIATKDFRGVRPYFKWSQAVPVVGYTDDYKKKHYFFFTKSAVVEDEILKQMLSGYEFTVGPPEMNYILSKRNQKDLRF